ncbi:tetratricopeptide repeat protein [Alphaproteobacteria bacterium]|nr:tetratricopeptide repeat protein [Alphaproteobacteria bacterium]
MLAKISVDQALMKAMSFSKKNKFVEAKNLYNEVLRVFPKNTRALQGLAALNKFEQNNNTQSPPQEVINKLVTLYNQGQISAVIEKSQILTEQYPNAFIVWNILGASTAQKGMLDEAIEAYKKSISLKPDFADPYYNMANALKDQGKLNEAITVYTKALSLKPNNFKAYSNIGLVLQNQGKLDEAIVAYNKSISLNPGYAEAYSNLGITFQCQGKLDEAVEAYKKSISLKPDYAETYNNLGAALHDQRKLDEAIKIYNKALLLKPDYAEAYSNLGATLKDQDNLDQAINAYKKAISFKPNYAEAYSNLGVALKDQGRLDDAIQAHKKSISLKSDYADAYNNMGNAFRDKGMFDEAIEVYNKSISIKPEFEKAHQNLTFALLNIGRLKEGLDKNEWRWKTGKFLSTQRHFSQPLWDGKQNLNGKRILLWCEQGIGDTLNWSSCLPLVASKAEHCILECQEKLVPLLKRSFPNVEVKPENRSLDKDRDDFDFHLPTGSLYKHFIEEIIQNPKKSAYLIPDPLRVIFWKERLSSLGKGPYIGVSWKSSVVSRYRLQHYPPISEWSPVFTIPDVTFINLQYNDSTDDLVKVKDEFGVTVHNFEDLDQYNNVDDVVALCAALDIVVTTKVTPMIFSSGVGTPTKIANWRQSLWNNILFNPVSSSVDMFERNTGETWDKVFSLIAKDISKQKNKTNNSKDKL